MMETLHSLHHAVTTASFDKLLPLLGLALLLLSPLLFWLLDRVNALRFHLQRDVALHDLLATISGLGLYSARPIGGSPSTTLNGDDTLWSAFLFSRQERPFKSDGPFSLLVLRPVYIHRAWHRTFCLWMRDKPRAFPMLPLIGFGKPLPSPHYISDEDKMALAYNYRSGPRPWWIFLPKSSWSKRMGYTFAFSNEHGTQGMLFYVSLRDWADEPEAVVTGFLELLDSGPTFHPQVDFIRTVR